MHSKWGAPEFIQKEPVCQVEEERCCGYVDSVLCSQPLGGSWSEKSYRLQTSTVLGSSVGHALICWSWLSQDTGAPALPEPMGRGGGRGWSEDRLGC